MPEVLNPGNAEVHQHLVDAIETRNPAVMATAIRDHDTNRRELGVFRPSPSASSGLGGFRGVVPPG